MMKVFETDVFIMTIHDDLLIEFKIKKDKTLEPKDVWESRDLSVNYLPGKKFLVLMEAADDIEISGEARRAGASEEYSKHVAALALNSSNLLYKIMGSLFLKINKPKIPTRFFDDRDDAIRWLKNFQNIT
jgi:hypothetical protein